MTEEKPGNFRLDDVRVEPHNFKIFKAEQITNFISDRIFNYDWSENDKTRAVIGGARMADIVLLSQKLDKSEPPKPIHGSDSFA
jgi:hypothetical protein